jgi:hypothetical protein
MTDTDKPRWVVVCRGKRLYTYATTVEEATNNFIAFGIDLQWAPDIDTEDWGVTLFENWSKARPGA